jgi:aryl-alcohol dehydrogenase-like predicted oxidoreductase
LGRFLHGQRGKVTLATKFGLRASPVAARLAVLQGAARRAIQLFPALRRTAVRNAGILRSAPTFSIATARSSLESSLRALRTDYVDFYLAHQASAEALPGEDLIGWLEGLKRAGTIRAYGVATDFDLLQPVLQQRPQLSGVVQFDSDPRSRNIEILEKDPQRLLITYTFIGRGVATLRDHPALAGITEEEVGGLLLRAAVLANPGGIVLMQSRSAARIERNVRAAQSTGDDERVRWLADLLRTTA